MAWESLSGQSGWAQDKDDDLHGKRRWPVVTPALVLLVLLVLLAGGGGYGFWRYNQSQYYVGVDQDGYVAIFRGTDQVLAGISLSSIAQRSHLKAGELRGGDQAALSQTIAQGSASDARLLVVELASQVNECRQQWRAVAAYQARLKGAAKSKGKAPGDDPGPRPAAPEAADCAPAVRQRA